MYFAVINLVLKLDLIETSEKGSNKSFEIGKVRHFDVKVVLTRIKMNLNRRILIVLAEKLKVL